MLRKEVVRQKSSAKTLKEKMVAEMLEEMVSVIEADSHRNAFVLQEICEKHPCETCIDSGFGVPCSWIGNSGAQQILSRRFRSCWIAASFASHSRTSIFRGIQILSFSREPASVWLTLRPI